MKKDVRVNSWKILQRFPKLLAPVKAGNTSEKLLNEICQTTYFLYQPKEITKIVITI